MSANEDGTLGPCGCVDYHYADCPLRTDRYDEPPEPPDPEDYYYDERD